MLAMIPAPPAFAVDAASDELHHRLAYHLRMRLTPSTRHEPQPLDPVDCQALRAFLAQEQAAVADRADLAPRDAQGFAAWFAGLKQDGPGQHHPLFAWLAEDADLAQMRWFLSQELSGEAGFDDLVALSQVKMPPRAKMEMARNLWDEFGLGNPQGVHAMLLERLADTLELDSDIDHCVWESLALANLMAGLPLERYAYQAVGALGVIELTAPGRVACVARGLHRLGVPPSARRYHELHATIDVERFRRWQAEVLVPLVAEDPERAPLLAEGALMRLEAGARCFDRYRAELY